MSHHSKKAQQWSILLEKLDEAKSPGEGWRAVPYLAASWLDEIADCVKPLERVGGSRLLLPPSSSSRLGPAAEAEKDMETLRKLLGDASGGPAESVKGGNAPMPQNIGIVPNANDEKIAEHYNYLVQMSSLSALYTGLWYIQIYKTKGRTEPYRISIASEAAEAFAGLADSAYHAMIGSLASYYNIGAANVNTYSKQMKRTEIHLDFLKEIFKPYKLTSDAYAVLDGVLTTFVNSIREIQVQFQAEQTTVNQTLRINQIVRTNVSGDPENPVWLHIPRTRIVHLKITNIAWKESMEKSGSQEYIDFRMEQTVVDADLNVVKYVEAKPKLDVIFETVTGMNLETFGKKTNPDPVKQPI